MQPSERQIRRFIPHPGVVGMAAGLTLLVGTFLANRPNHDTRLRAPVLAAPPSPQRMEPPPASPPRGTRGLLVFVKRGRGVKQLRSGASVCDGDLIQIGYGALQATHGVIFSVDGWGVVTLHHPARVQASTALEPFGRQLLPYAFELDGAPAYERILLVTGNGPIDVAAVLAAGRAMAAQARSRPELPHGLKVSDTLILKKNPTR